MYVRIYYTGGFIIWISTFLMKRMVYGMSCRGDYYIPCLILPTEKEHKPIGLWGQRHKRYLQEHNKIFYTTLLTSGKLNEYLVDVDKQTEERFERLVEQMKQSQGITEQLKSENALEWVQRMNNIHACARKIVNKEIIFG